MTKDEEIVRLNEQIQQLNAKLQANGEMVAKWQNAINLARARVNSAKLLHKNAGDEAAINHQKAVERVQQAFGEAADVLDAAVAT
jgi:hypothetical protein